jgi:hypothetical protein
VIISVAVPGQKADIPKWAGTWELDVKESSFGKILFPGAPVDFTLLSQRAKLEQATDKLKMSADIVYSDADGPHKVHEESSLRLDGQKTIIGPGSLSFGRIDDSTFDIISRLNTKNTNVGEVSHFAVSSAGQTLTETKTQTEREAVPKDAEKNSGAVIRTSISVLVFRKLLTTNDNR